MIRYGTNPIAWSNDDDQSLGADISLETCLSEAASIGFDGIEKGHKFPSDPQALKEVLAPYGLDFVSGWHSLNLLSRSVEDEKHAIQPHLDLLKTMGCKICIVCETSNAIHGDDTVPLEKSPVLPARQWAGFGAHVEAIAEYCAAQNITLAYHHHMGTIVETAEDIDTFMRVAGPVTQLLLDTGHAVLAGADPEGLAQKYMPRIAHIHCKNVRARIRDDIGKQNLTFLEAVRRGVFTVPGDPEGIVNFEAVLRIAAAHNYAGWLVIEAEQDPAVRSPYIYQSMGLKALKSMAMATGLDKNNSRN